MTDDPTLARHLLDWMRDAGHDVLLEPCGDGWRASCQRDGHSYVAVRPTALNAICALAESAGFDLEG